jgi:glucose/mannose-6-phosphate isomerase
MVVVAAEVASLAGVAPRLHTEIDAAAAFLTDQAETLQQQAREIAALVAGAVPVIYGSDLTAPVARRWKTQVNENAKFPAWWGELPEADHNELLGWSGAVGDERAAAIFLEDRDQHPRVARRFELTAKSVEPGAAAVARVETAGETRLERMLWAVMLGDLVTLELARQRGVDPLPVEAIERFKEEMG